MQAEVLESLREDTFIISQTKRKKIRLFTNLAMAWNENLYFIIHECMHVPRVKFIFLSIKHYKARPRNIFIIP